MKIKKKIRKLKRTKSNIKKIQAWAIIDQKGKIIDAIMEDGCGYTNALQIQDYEPVFIYGNDRAVKVTITYSLPTKKK